MVIVPNKRAMISEEILITIFLCWLTDCNRYPKGFG